MIDFSPPSIAFQLGPIPVYFYGICYAIGLALTYFVILRGVRARGLNEAWFANGMIIVAVAALIGGRAYHVIDQWALYKDDLLRIVEPPYAGLGVYGGIFAGAIAVIAYARYHRQSFWVWADVIAPGLFAMEFVARWGNFFNQELYGPPTTAPWGIAIDCAHRVVGYLCPPGGTTPAGAHFQPLFLYESLSGLIGMLTLLWLSHRFAARLRTGEVALVFLIWYAAVRFVLEFLRVDNWTFFGIPMAQLISATVVVVALALLVRRHGRIPPGLSPPAESEPEPADPESEHADPGPADAPDAPEPVEAGAAGT